MAVNKSKGNMYVEWDTWNVVKGECYHNCSYCYMKRWGNQKPVRLDEKELIKELSTFTTVKTKSNLNRIIK